MSTSLTNTKRERILVPTSNEPPAEMWSNCFKVGDQVIIAGMTSKDVDGSIRALGDAYRQSVHSFERMRDYMEAAGGSLNDVVKINVYLTDIALRSDFIKARKEFFSGDFPPAVVIGNVTLASDQIMVEIDAWGILGSGPKA